MKWFPIAFVALALDVSLAFAPSQQKALTPITSTKSLFAYPPRKNRRGGNEPRNEDENDDYDPILDEPEGRRGDGRNWIEKSSPVGIGKLVEESKETKEKETDGNYDLGVNGESFQTGELSERMYDALMSVAAKRFPAGAEIPSELEDVYKIYAMDVTAKEAVKAALDQNGLELAIDDEESQDEGLWGDIDAVYLIDPETGKVEEGTEEYDSFDTAVEEGDWEPGQPFNFVVRNVPARLKEMDISDLLSQLDPEGKLRNQAKEKGMTLPDEDVASLKDLEVEVNRRVKLAPYEAEDENSVYKGDGSKGYNIMKRSDLLVESGNVDGAENDSTLMHVMDALVSHSCLVVDVTDGGTRFGDALKLSKMWETSSDFFDAVNEDEGKEASLPGMQVAEGAGSTYAKVGYANMGEGSMKFLETRVVRGSTSKIVPSEAESIIGEGGVKSFVDSFDVMCAIGKDIVRVAVTAANMEYDSFMRLSSEESSDLPMISGLTFDDNEIAGIADVDEEGNYVDAARMSSEAALLLAEELIDDGKKMNVNVDEGGVNMSPHRICRYQGKSSSDKSERLKETFGAHTDTSFMTLVPVAAISGLEIFDEAANVWLRPELMARKTWEADRAKQGLDTSAQTEKVIMFDGDEEKEVELPWHCRYVVAMPGELLQIATRNEVAAAVHRVVSVADGDARISAPVLLRARSGMRMNISKYFGDIETAGSLLKECDGMKLEDIHNALQPKRK